MRINRDILVDFAYSTLANLTGDELGARDVEIEFITRAELCLSILRAVAEGKKRFVIDIVPRAAKAEGGDRD